MVPKQKLDRTITVTEQSTGKKKGSCSAQRSQKAELRLVKTIKMFATPNFAMCPLFGDKNVLNLILQLFFFFLFGAFPHFGLLGGIMWGQTSPH